MIQSNLINEKNIKLFNNKSKKYKKKEGLSSLKRNKKTFKSNMTVDDNYINKEFILPPKTSANFNNFSRSKNKTVKIVSKHGKVNSNNFEGMPSFRRNTVGINSIPK